MSEDENQLDTIEIKDENLDDVPKPEQHIDFIDDSLFTLSPEIKVNQNPAITYFKGQPVRYVSFSTEAISINANSIYTGVQVIRFKGILRDFTCTVNDENIAVFVQIKDHENGRIVINDKTMKKISLIGRGISHGETREDVTGTSRDVVGVGHPIKPYLMRYKNQPTGTETDPLVYAGTDDDLYITLDYAPDEPYEFTELVFNVINTNSQGIARLIHFLEIGVLQIISDENYKREGEYVLPKDVSDKVNEEVLGDQKVNAAKAFLYDSPIVIERTKHKEYRLARNIRKVKNIVAEAEDQG
jgi:hypothetical protein